MNYKATIFPPHFTSQSDNLTECERIIRQGIIAEQFLNPEMRCEFQVTTELKKIWAVALDSLIKFDEICKKHHLRYFLAYGTLLGAVRHKGFIPWDDDMDVFMLREDYDRLLDLGDEFTYPYFLQTAHTDPGYFFSYAKLRNSNTTCITTQFRYQKVNWGQNFDIFPLDNFNPKDGEAFFAKVAELGTDLSNYMRSSNPNPSTEEERKRIACYSGRCPWEIYDELQQHARRYDAEPTDYLAVTSAYLYGFQKGLFFKADFEDCIPCKFENVTSFIPKGYDRILRIIYGDYRQFPPVEKRGIWHGNIIYNPDRPYIEVQHEAGIEY